MNNNLASILAYLYPQGRPGIDWVVRQDGESSPCYIASWSLAGVTQPTEAEVMSHEAEYLASFRRRRRLYDIWQQLNGLTAGQQNNIWTNITSGTPPLWATDAGSNAAGIMALHWSATNSGATAANLNDAKRRLVAMYCQDNVKYLVNPTFDPTINVPGDEPL